MLNSGSRKSTRYMLGSMEYGLFGPKAFAGNVRLPRSLASRCIPIIFRRKKPSEVVARFDPGAPLPPEIAAVRNSLNGIVPDWIAEFANETPHNLPPNLTAHQQDCAEPLLHIANAIGGPWPERARAAIVAVLALCESSCSLQMLEDVRECFQLKQNPEYLVTRDLLALLSDYENRPWSAWPRNSGRRLGALLQPFGIKSHTIKAEALKGYRFCDFKDAWERYLAPLTLLAEASSEPALGNVSETASAPTSVTGNSMNGEELQAGIRLTWEDRRLLYVVREPFVSRHSQAGIVAGMLEADEELILESLMPSGGVVFSDGMEADFLQFNSGARARVHAAEQRAQLVVPRGAEMQVTVDIVIFTIQSGVLKVLLVKRGVPPFGGQFAIPGGFVHEDEDLEHAALRELEEETGVRDVNLEQLYSFGETGRDPRGRVITVAYFALISADRPLTPGSDAADAAWWPADKLPPLAFDHRKILDYAVERLRNKLEYTTVGFQLLPEKFTLSELQGVYEAILGRKLDKRNFRRKMSLLKILKPLQEVRRGGRRPARLFRFMAGRFEKLKDKGILFPF